MSRLSVLRGVRRHACAAVRPVYAILPMVLPGVAPPAPPAQPAATFHRLEGGQKMHNVHSSDCVYVTLQRETEG